MDLLKPFIKKIGLLALLVGLATLLPHPAQAGSAKLLSPELKAQAATGKPTQVIVMLTGYKDLALTGPSTAANRQALRRRVGLAQTDCLAKLSGQDYQLVHRFQNLAALSLKVTESGLDKLLALNQVAVVYRDRPLTAHTAQGLPLIRPGGYRSLYGGRGVAIAVVDTGIDYTHPQLGGIGFPNAKVIGGYDFGDNDTDPMDCNGHGTAVAGIAAGDPAEGTDFAGGVAPEAKLYALKIVSGCFNQATTSSLIAAWDWAVTHRDDSPDNPIRVINTSFGGGRYLDLCDDDDPALAQAAANAAAAGITIVVSAGNDGYCDALNIPACLSGTIAVGAVYDADHDNQGWCVASQACQGSPHGGCADGAACYDSAPTARDICCYSNSGPFLDVLAPSTTTSVPAPGAGLSQLTGTSAASPYVAGAVALILSRYRVEGLELPDSEQIKEALVQSGQPITDPKSGQTDPLIDIEAALGRLSGQEQVTVLQARFGLNPGQEAPFLIDVPAGAGQVSASLSDVEGDPDLYLARGRVPTTTDYDSRSINPTGSDELCDAQNPAAGAWYVMVRGQSQAACTLRLSYTIPAEPQN